MKPLGKVMALLLLLAVVSPVHGVAQPQPARCHEHGKKAPAPNPVTYQCCRAGHQLAAVREALNLRAPFVAVSRAVESAATPSAEIVWRAQLRPLASVLRVLPRCYIPACPFPVFL